MKTQLVLSVIIALTACSVRAQNASQPHDPINARIEVEIQDGVLKILSKSDNIVVCDFKEPEGFVIRAGIPSDARLMVTVLGSDPECSEWAALGSKSIARAYGPDEPEYTLADIKSR